MTNVSWYGQVWANLKQSVETAWPEITAIFTDTRIERTDWINALNSDQLAAPWCIIKAEVSQTKDWGAGVPRFQVDFTISYICPISAAPAGQTITELLASKMATLQAALYAADIGTVLPTLPVSINADNDINRVLLDAKLNYQAANLTTSCIVVPN